MNPATEAPPSIAQALHWAETALAPLQDDAGREARILLADLLERDPAWLYAFAETPLTTETWQRYRDCVQRRAEGEPVAYLTGRRGFWSLTLTVNDAVLIPRPETELLVELALERLPTDGHVLDLGAGSGAIALALAAERPDATVTAVEQSAWALATARNNAARLELDRVRWLQGDWFTPLTGERFDLIVSNPPYIGANEPELAQGDVRFEPVSALVSGADGLDAIRHIVVRAPDHLKPGGWLLIEHGYAQGEAVRGLFRQAGFAKVDTRRDLQGHERATIGVFEPGAGGSIA